MSHIYWDRALLDMRFAEAMRYVESLEAQRDELVALVERVEFIQDNGPRNRDYDVCPWCDSWMRDGHAPDCPRQAVLAKVRQ